jgi:hypothetical protein
MGTQSHCYSYQHKEEQNKEFKTDIDKARGQSNSFPKKNSSTNNSKLQHHTQNQIFKKYSNKKITHQNIQRKNSIFLFDKKYIRDDEKNKIKFTVSDLINFIQSIKALDYELIEKNNDISIELHSNGSCFNENIPIIHIEFAINKNGHPKIKTIKDIAALMMNSQNKLNIDQTIKSINTIENKCNNIAIHHTIYKGNFLMSERELIDKKIFFTSNDLYYYFASSIPDQLIPLKNGIQRINCFFMFIIIKNTSDDFIFNVYKQADEKLKITRAMMKKTIPQKITDIKNNLNNNSIPFDNNVNILA